MAACEGGWRCKSGGGFMEVKKTRQIEIADITPALARRSGFAGVVDLFKIAKTARARTSI